MDAFMDKLAQKLTAQEMIKANSAADAEELSRLQKQVKEYHDCLTQMQKVNQELKMITGQMNRLVTEDFTAKTAELTAGGAESVEQIKKLVEESLGKIREIEQNKEQLEELKKILEDRISQAEEYVHKENVKVYRNVQAVVVEESAKQTEALQYSTSELKGKWKAVFGVSIATLVLVVGSLVFQILEYLQII